MTEVAQNPPPASARIARNAGSLLVAQVITWVLTMALTVVMRRVLGPTLTGDLTVYWSMWGTIGVLASFGMDVWVAKEVARDHERAPRILGTTLLLRVGLQFLAASAVLGIGIARHQSPAELLVAQVFGMAVLMQSLSAATTAVLQGLETMHHISISSVLYKAVHTALGVSVLIVGGKVLAMGVVSIASGFIFFALQLGMLWRLSRVRPVFSRALAIPMLWGSVGYVVNVIVMVGYSQIDVLILAPLLPREEIGWYGVTQQLIGTMLFGVTAFTTALFPQMTRAHVDDPDGLRRLIGRGLELMWWLSVPMAAGLAVVAKPTILLLYGQAFAPSASLLAMSSVVLVLTYLNSLLGCYLTAIERQYVSTTLILIGLLAKVPIDYFLFGLARQYLHLGVAVGLVSTALAELLMIVVVVSAHLPKGALERGTVTRALRVVVSSALMVAGTLLVRPWGLAPTIIVGVAIYATCSLTFDTLTPEQWGMLRPYLRKVYAKLPSAVKRLLPQLAA